MWKALSSIQKNLIGAIPISMLIGLAFGGIFDARPLKNFIIPITFIMVYPMMVTLNIKSVFMGTHGHGKLDDLMIGNISSGVIRTSSKPVLIVRIPEMKR